MKVAVIIVEFNSAEETIQYVNQIGQYENIHRIVIVDNASTDFGQVELLKQIQNEKVIILQSDKNGGYNYGNNFGIQYLEKIGEKYDYFIISNSDIMVEKLAIDRCLEILEKNKKLAIVAPRMYDKKNCPMRRSSWKIRSFWRDVIHSTRLLELLFFKQMRQGEYSEKNYSSQNLLEVEVISGAFFVIKYQVYKEIGGFDENVFLFYEEDILAEKIQNKGYKIGSINDVKYTHYESQTIGKTLSYYHKMKQLYQSKLYYHKTYHHIHFMQRLLFKILYIFRIIELIIEIPIRKIVQK